MGSYRIFVAKITFTVTEKHFTNRVSVLN